MQQCRLIAAISHLSDIGCGKTGFSKKPEFFRTLSILKSSLTGFSFIFFTNKLMSFGMFAFPWALIEYSQYKNLYLMQILQFTQGAGLALIIVVFNVVFSLVLNKYFCSKLNLLQTLLSLSLICIFPLLLNLAGYLLLNYASLPSDFINVTVIQTNSSIESQKSLYSPDKIKKILYEEILKSPKGIILTPESSLVEPVRFSDTAFSDKMDGLSKNTEKTIILGALDEKDKNRLTNSVLVFDKKINDLSRYIYNKQFLVPFGEFVPFYEYIPKTFLYFIDRLTGVSFVRGEAIKIVPTKYGNISPSICYEIIFPELIKKQACQGADILVNLSNLSWFHDTIIKDQFIAFGVFRAAEVRKPFIISVNTGYSAVIGPNGQIKTIIPKNIRQTKTVRLEVF
jgi:apolipoprotein N-acyltransferase